MLASKLSGVFCGLSCIHTLHTSLGTFYGLRRQSMDPRLCRQSMDWLDPHSVHNMYTSDNTSTLCLPCTRYGDWIGVSFKFLHFTNTGKVSTSVIAAKSTKRVSVYTNLTSDQKRYNNTNAYKRTFSPNPRKMKFCRKVNSKCHTLFLLFSAFHWPQVQ